MYNVRKINEISGLQQMLEDIVAELRAANPGNDYINYGQTGFYYYIDVTPTRTLVLEHVTSKAAAAMYQPSVKFLIEKELVEKREEIRKALGLAK